VAADPRPDVGHPIAVVREGSRDHAAHGVAVLDLFRPDLEPF
jgi:hypothetical protein